MKTNPVTLYKPSIVYCHCFNVFLLHTQDKAFAKLFICLASITLYSSEIENNFLYFHISFTIYCVFHFVITELRHSEAGRAMM
jgi:hypothetical protein